MPGLWVVVAAALTWSGISVFAQDSPSPVLEPSQIVGIASFYGINHKGRTASGVPYDGSGFTAAHRTLPFGTRLRVTAPHNKRSVVVVVNDRGPFIKGRVLDLSMAAAKELQMVDRGLIKVTAAVEPEP